MHNFPQQKWSQYLEQLCSFCVNAPFFVKKIRENRYICPAQRAKQQISIYFWLFSFLIQSTAIKAIEQLLNKSLSWLTVVIPLAVGKVQTGCSSSATRSSKKGHWLAWLYNQCSMQILRNHATMSRVTKKVNTNVSVNFDEYWPCLD